MTVQSKPALLDGDALLTMKEAMRYLRASRSTIYRLMWSGRLPGHKIGVTWRFYRSDVLAVAKQAEPPRNGPLPEWTKEGNG